MLQRGPRNKTNYRGRLQCRNAGWGCIRVQTRGKLRGKQEGRESRDRPGGRSRGRLKGQTKGTGLG